MRLNQKGQFAIEAVLLMTILVGLFLFLTKTMKEKEVLQDFTEKSVKNLKSMTVQGTWKPECKPIKGAGRERGGNCHPNSINRALSSDPL